MGASLLGAFAPRSSVEGSRLWLTNVGLVGEGSAALCHRIAIVVCKSSGWWRGRLRETGLSRLSSDRFGEWQVPRPAYTPAYRSSKTDIYNQQREVS